MKVLYLGYLAEQSEWGTLSQNFVRALAESGVDLATRTIRIRDNAPLPNDIVPYSLKKIEGTELIIQHLFPDSLVRWGNGRNVGLITLDFFELKDSSWVEKFKLMDELWVVTEGQKKSLEEVGFTNVRIVPLPIHDSIYKQQFSIPAQLKQQLGTLDSQFRVHLPTMDLGSLEKSASIFFSEFDTTDNAGLLISCPQELTQKVQEVILKVKNSLRLKPSDSLYIQEAILPVRTEADLYTLHNYADASISNNSTSGFTLKEVDALGFGCPVLSHASSALNEFFVDERLSVNFSYKVCKDRTSPWADMYNGRDYQPDMCEMDAKQKLRNLYNDWSKNQVTYKTGWKKLALEFVEKHTFRSVGTKIKELLNV